MGLFSSSQPSQPAALTPSAELKNQIESQITQELAVVNATELVNKITENCFDKCIQYPEDQITAQQNTCLDQCIQRYMRSWNAISKSYVSRIQNEK